MSMSEGEKRALVADHRKWRLPSDVVVTALRDIDEEVRKDIFGERQPDLGQYCLRRTHARTLPKLINKNVADVLNLFGEAGASYSFVLASLSSKMHLPYEKVDEELLPLVVKLIRSNLLVEVAAGAGADGDAIAPSLATGDRWGDYVVQENMKVMIDSEIHRVRHRASGDVRVLKIAQGSFPNAEMKAVIAERLQREFTVLREIKHPYVVRVHESGVENGRAYGILDYADGGSVRSFLFGENQTQDDATVLKFALQCVEALEAVHRAGYLHGDVHTGNFLVKDGHVCLIDFGLLRPIRIEENDPSRYHEGGVVMYMPPEAVKKKNAEGEQKLWGSVAGEIYSCAVIVFAMLTGRYPYEWTAYRKDYMRRIIEQPPLSFEECGRNAWPEMETILGKALAKSPNDRFGSMRQFRRALEGIQHTAASDNGRPAETGPAQTAGERGGEMR